MPLATRITLVAMAIATLAGMISVPVTDARNLAPAARNQTLFGMNVPSLAQLDASESAIGARAAIVGTLRRLGALARLPAWTGRRDQRTRRRRGHLLGAVGLVARRRGAAAVRTAADRHRLPRPADRSLGKRDRPLPTARHDPVRAGDERGLAPVGHRPQRQPPRRLCRRVAARAPALRTCRSTQRRLGLESGDRLRGRDPPA